MTNLFSLLKYFLISIIVLLGFFTYVRRPKLLSTFVFLLLSVFFGAWISFLPLADTARLWSYFPLLLLIALAGMFLYVRISATSSLKRQRARVLFFGIILVLFVSFLTIYFGFSKLLLFSAIAFLSLISSYMILHYKPFAVDSLIRRTITTSIIVALVVGSYYFFVFISQFVNVEIYRLPLFSILLILFFLFSYDMLDGFIGSLIDRFLFGSRQNFQKLLAEISDNISTLLDISKIIVTIKNELVTTLSLLGVEILVANPDENKYLNDDKSVSIAMDDPLVKIVKEKKDGLITIDEFREEPSLNEASKALLATMKKLNASSVIPMVFREGITGLIFLGERQQKQLFFNQNEIGFLRNVAFQAAVAVENAKLYENLEESKNVIEELHTNLEKKVTDRTHQVKDKTEELNKLNVALQDATERKSEFLANMSHELRTPLNAVLGFAELIQSGIYGEISEKIKQAIAEMQKSGNHLLGLINDVLDLSNVEAGKIDLNKVDFAIKDVIEFVQFSTKSLLDGKGLYLKISLGRNLPVLLGDQKRINQVLINLIGNSAKFTKKGGITLRVKRKDDAVLFEVEDTGVGIAKEKLGDVFKEFKQVHVGEYGGTGLGLAICKRLIELHDGKIWVESRMGKGTKFSFLIPIKN